MRIVIAEDAALFRAGLVRLLQDEGHQVRAAVADGAALLAAVAEHHPDVLCCCTKTREAGRGDRDWPLSSVGDAGVPWLSSR
jgi:DNA-binding NarL/FixJ family response regulator